MLFQESSLFVRVYYRYIPESRFRPRASFTRIEETYTSPQSAFLVGILSLKQLRYLIGKNMQGHSVILLNIIPVEAKPVTEGMITFTEHMGTCTHRVPVEI